MLLNRESRVMLEEHAIKSHWQAHPVGENVFGCLYEDFAEDYVEFFDAYDRFRYSKEGHILRALDKFDWRGKKVLEIGPGQGADSEQLVRRGAHWSGIDLTIESIKRVKKRFKIRNLSFDQLVQGSVLKLPFEDRSFDMVYSHGVLHHIPDIRRAQSEIRRVLSDDGRLIIMLYARNSLNYHVAIKFVRRIGLACIYHLHIPLSGIFAKHKKLAREVGLREYLRIENFIHKSTDGPNNPYSKVYDQKTIEEDFPDFKVLRTFKFWMHAPPLPVHWLPGESLLGWHMWAELAPRI
jgi:ubiquinone/menaquinone biosynthesis C-methylase UbiE